MCGRTGAIDTTIKFCVFVLRSVPALCWAFEERLRGREGMMQRPIFGEAKGISPTLPCSGGRMHFLERLFS